MANNERGEVDVVVKQKDGDEKTYTLQLSMNAACVLEERLKKRIGEILADSSLLSFQAIRHLVWVLLQAHHGEEFANTPKGLEKTGKFIDDAGGINRFFKTLNELSKLNSDDASGGGDGSGNPPSAQDGPGDAST